MLNKDWWNENGFLNGFHCFPKVEVQESVLWVFLFKIYITIVIALNMYYVGSTVSADEGPIK